MEKKLIVRERLNRLSQPMGNPPRQQEAEFDANPGAGSMTDLKRLQNPQAYQKARFNFKLHTIR